MRAIYSSITLLFSVIVFSACDPISIGADIPDQSAKICINGIFRPDSTWVVHLTRGKYILDSDADASPNSKYVPLDNATITIYEGNETIPLEHFDFLFSNYFEGGWYRNTSKKPHLGKTYTIKASMPGLGEATATATIPQPVQIEKIETVSIIPDETGVISIDVYIKDPEGVPNYYQLFQAGTNTPHNEWEIKTQDSRYSISYDDSPLYGNQSSFKPAIFNDVGMDGQLLKIPVTVFKDQSVTIQLRSISKEYYQYYTSNFRQSFSDQTTLAQAVYVFSNIENGFGIFAGYSQSEYKLYP
jgi:hypothetical protein